MPVSEETDGNDLSRRIDFAWRAHQAIQDWTRAVDQKASIILTLALVLATLAAHEVLGPDGGLHATSGTKLWVVRVMGAAFAASVVMAMSSSYPASVGVVPSAHQR